MCELLVLIQGMVGYSLKSNVFQSKCYRSQWHWCQEGSRENCLTSGATTYNKAACVICSGKAPLLANITWNF